MLSKVWKEAKRLWDRVDKVFLMKLLVTVFVSTSIGMFLGLFILQVTGEEETDTSVMNVKSEQEKVDVSVDSFTYYVVQAGVFQEKENASSTAEAYEGAYIWEEDGKFSVLVDLHLEKEALDNKYGDDPTYFIKERTIKVEEENLNQTERELLNGMYTWIREGLTKNSETPLDELVDSAEIEQGMKLYELVEWLRSKSKEKWTSKHFFQLMYQLENGLGKG